MLFEKLPTVTAEDELFFRPAVYHLNAPIKTSGAIVPLNQQKCIELQASKRAAYWHEEGPYVVDPEWVERHIQLLEQGGIALPRLEGYQLRGAARKFTFDTACGADNAAPRAYAILDDEALELLAAVFVACEDAGKYPQ